MRHPRQHSEKHLDFVRSLSCVVCGDNTSTEAAHIRMPAMWAGKRPVGTGEKPDDKWTIPLCSTHHRKQHEVGEAWFWNPDTAEPIRIALALWAATGDHELGEQIVRAAQ